MVEVYLGSINLKHGLAPWDPWTDEAYDTRTRKQRFFRPYGRAWQSSVRAWYSESLRPGVEIGRRRTVCPLGVVVTTRSVSSRVGRRARTGQVDLLWWRGTCSVEGYLPCWKAYCMSFRSRLLACTGRLSLCNLWWRRFLDMVGILFYFFSPRYIAMWLHFLCSTFNIFVIWMASPQIGGSCNIY
jgi:hypothetical protein